MSNRAVGGFSASSSFGTGGWIVAAVGVGLGVVGGWHVSATSSGDPVELGWELFVYVGLPLSIAAAAGVVARRRRSKDLIVLRWVLGSVLALTFLGAWASYDSIAAGDYANARANVALGSNLGLLLGAVAGLNRSRAVQNAELAERERAQREGMAFLNHLLRHHVRNGMTIIDGYVDELRTGERSEAHVRVIDRQSDRILTLVENAETLVRALSGEVDPEPVDLDGVVERAVADARETYPAATFEVETDPATVLANDLVRSVLDNLLVNAVEHHDGDPTVEVTVTGGDPVVVTVADDGLGVPEAVRESFDRRDDVSTGVAGEGIGLYLVATLVRNYGGDVRIEDREPRGTVVTVELPSA